MIFVSSLKYILKKHLMRVIQPKQGYVLAKNIQGSDMILKLEDSIGNPYPNVLWMNGVYEVETTTYIKKNVKKGDVVLDIGSNFGYFTLMLAKQVGGTGKVHAFEPNPEMFKILSENVKMNGYNNVVLHNVAVADEVGAMMFFVNARWAGVSSLYAHVLTEKAIQVNTVTIDSLGLNDVAFVKIDVEGAESIVLDGMKETIKRNKDMNIILEFRPGTPGFDAINIFNNLIGFRTKNIDGNLLCERI